jgi:hypothetical protein
MKRSIVYKNRPDNNAPGPFSLLSPEDDSEEFTVLIFDWEDTIDPDGDEVTYNLIIATDNHFNNVAYLEEGIRRSLAYVDKSAALLDLTDYYWKVEAVDECGAVTTSETRHFHTDNTNIFYSLCIVSLFSALDKSPIIGARVEIGDKESYDPDSYFYLFTLAPVNSINITASATGYADFSGTASVQELDIVDIEVYMTPLNSSPGIGDIADQGIFADASTGPISFNVWDQETPAESLNLSSVSSDTDLVPNGNIVFGGSAGNRAVTVTPAAGQSGTATITVTVSDGQASASDSFVLTVTAKALPGDLNGDNSVDQVDLSLALKVLAGISADIRDDYVTCGADVNGDGRIGMHEVIYIKEKIEGVRE